MRKFIPLIASVLCVLAASESTAQTSTLPSTGVSAVSTYESVGLYWQSPGGTAGCEVKYRKSGESAWRQGLAMWYDARDGQCRGSIVGLEPGAWYQAELNLPGQAATRGVAFQTWSNAKPVAKTIAIPSGSATYNIAEGGSPTGWVVYEGNGATLDGGNSATYNITVNASYVIIRGLNLRGAKQDAIRLTNTVHDVVIEDNDISGWGRTRDGTWATDLDSGIRGYCSSQDQLMRVTIQRNRIHDPRYSANSWSDGHPAGAQAISFSHCGGQLVIRHNEIYSTTGRYFNDGIGGEDNFTKAGFPNSDSDIYGNRISHTWDDGIESEGANENVRIWGNYIDRTAIGIATTATSVGPIYIFRNVWNRAQMYAKAASLDSDDRQPFFKSGGDNTLGHGRRYIMHNTMLQATQSGLSYGLGGGFGLGGTGSAQLIENTWSSNNIYHQWKDGKGFTYQTGSTSKFSNDMYNGTAGDTSVTNGIVGKPVYLSGHGWQSEAGGNYQLASNSPGYGRGAKIANFNDGVAAPDVGAHQSGTASMKFGIAASPGSAAAGGGTTTPTTPTTPPSTGGGGGGGTASGIALSATTLAFGSVRTQTVTYTNNTGAKVTFIQASISSARYGQSNNCGEVAAGASCTATVTYNPANSGADLATFTMTSTAPNSPHVVSLTASTSPASTPPAALVVNLSTRVRVMTGDDVMIGGFVIQGSTPKTVVVRARGPSLAAAGVTGVLANPQVELYSGQTRIAANDDFGTAPNAAQLQSSGFAPSDSREAALLLTLAPGAYSAVVSGVGGTSGIGIMEVFQLDRPESPLVNVSTRAQVRGGNDAMIGGFIIEGSAPRTVVVRARGPSLAAAGVAGALANPTLTLVRSSDNATIGSNDDWQQASNAGAVGSSGFAPSDGREAALLVTLAPGAYSVVVGSATGATGVGIVEVFTVP